MSLFKNIQRSAAFRWTLCLLGAAYIRLVRVTSRWQVIGGEIPERYWNANKPFIVCFWHGRLLMMPYCWNFSHPIHMLISIHRDGLLISQTVKRFGIETVAGSTSKGGAMALRHMAKLLAGGTCVGITPDGPRGPRMRSGTGIVGLARLSGVPIIPVSFSISRGKNLGSWDRFLVGGLFGRGVFVWGEPIEVPGHADAERLEQARLRVEQAMNDITNRADLHAGRIPVEPADKKRNKR